MPPFLPVSAQLALIAEMSRDFARSRDLAETLMRALTRICDQVGAEGGALFLVEEEQLVCRASVGPINLVGLSLAADQGIVGRSVQENEPRMVRDAAHDPDFHKQVDDQTGFTTRSLLCAPMSVKDRPIGAIELVNQKKGDNLFAEADLQLLLTLASSAALAIDNARMAEALVEQERDRRELELAAEIQRSLLPRKQEDDFPLHGVNVAARRVSGDFYDFFTLADGRICFGLGDVSGKGMNAALLMAKTVSLFRCLGKTIPEPGRLLARVNSEICETATLGMFVTMIAGIFDPRSGLLRLANAGHEPALFFPRGGKCLEFAATAPPLGITPLLLPEYEIPEVEFQLAGGTLYLFTDGVTEGVLADGRRLGSEGVREMLRAVASRPPPERLTAVVARLVRAGEPLADDLTMLSVHDRIELHAPLGVPPEREKLLRLDFSSNPERLRLVRSLVGESARLCGFGSQDGQDLVLAIDEACQNVIRHNYKNKNDGPISLEIRRGVGSMEFLLRDWGDLVDPAKIKPRDLDDIRPGGLGTHFIREIMDEVEFLSPPFGGGNLLRMVKKMGGDGGDGTEQQE